MNCNTKSAHSDLVGEVFCEVIEKLAFMFGEPVGRDAIDRDVPRCLKTSMTFCGAKHGSFQAVVPIPMCAQIAGNVLGIDAEDERVITSAADAIKEMLNVACGHVLTSLAGDEPVFNLSVPVTTELDNRAWIDLLEADNTVTLIVDDMPVLLRLEIRE